MTTEKRFAGRLQRLVLVAVAMMAASTLTRSVAAALVAQEDRTTGNVSYAVEADGMITINFAGQSPDSIPQFTRASVAADQGVDGSSFHGNYRVAQIETVSFLVRADAVPGNARLVLRGGPDLRLWTRSVEISPTSGDWAKVTVPMTLEGGWQRNDTDLPAKWAEDLSDVAMIGIEIQRGGFEAQSYSITGFVLNDPSGPGAAATLSEFESALWNRFGVVRIADLSDAQRRMDSLGDGLADWERVLAEHDEEFARNLFQVRIAEVDEDGVLIEWIGIRGSTYTVVRMDMSNVGAGLVELPGGIGMDLPVAVTGRMTFKDTSATDGGNYAYAVRRNTEITGD